MTIDINARELALLSLGSICFGSFVWGTIKHFVWEGGGSRGAWVVSMLSWVAFLLFVAGVLIRPNAPTWLVSSLLFIVAEAIWAWALITTRRGPPTLAFTEDDPTRLYAEGPYRWIRHPFYTSYLSFWAGAALATLWLPSLVAVLILGGIYLAAARHEEGKFGRSGLSGSYRRYAARTGMFLPRLTRSRLAIH